jgi:hypothetical protein
MKKNSNNHWPLDGMSDGKLNIATQKLRRSVDTVLDRLPTKDKHELKTFWNRTRFTDPTEGVYVAPRFALCPGFQDMMTERGGESPMVAIDGGISIFDKEFIEAAPPEAIETAVAKVLADAYARATGTRKSDADGRELHEQEIVTRWGFLPDDVAVWMASKITWPSCPTEKFYAFRYARFNRPPPASADLFRISELLRSNGCPEHAQQVLTIRSALN